MNRMSSRLLQLLLCALLIGAMSLTARAVARPENRVWNFFPSPLKSAADDLDKALESRPENPTCGYDFASGVRKYLYTQGNPVNMVDPSGHDGDFISTLTAISIGVNLVSARNNNGALPDEGGSIVMP